LTRRSYVGCDNYLELALDDPLFRKVRWASRCGSRCWPCRLRVGFALFMAHVLNYQAARHQLLPGGVLPAVHPGRIDRRGGAVALHFCAQRAGQPGADAAGPGARDAWLADEHYSMWTIVLLFTWQFGSAMVIFLAALQNVPVSLYEAAESTAPASWQQFWRITVPLITPVIFFNMIMQMVHAFQEFNGPYMITEGGPLQSTYVLALYIYDQSFRFFNLGYGAALSWVLFALVGALSALSFWSSRYWVFYAGEKERGK
jgi:oligogalacturonide transport system permease protein